MKENDSWECWLVKVLPGEGDYPYLIEGECYRVLVDLKNLVTIIDEKGNHINYFKDRFTKVGVRIWTLEETIDEIRKEVNGNKEKTT